MSELNNIALKILSKGKGILAADESTATMSKRLDGVKVESSEKNRLLNAVDIPSNINLKCIPDDENLFISKSIVNLSFKRFSRLPY